MAVVACCASRLLPRQLLCCVALRKYHILYAQVCIRTYFGLELCSAIVCHFTGGWFRGFNLFVSNHLFCFAALPPPDYYGSCLAFQSRQDFCTFFPRRRQALKCAYPPKTIRRSQQLTLLFFFFLHLNSKSHHGGILTHGPTCSIQIV